MNYCVSIVIQDNEDFEGEVEIQIMDKKGGVLKYVCNKNTDDIIKTISEYHLRIELDEIISQDKK